MEYVRIIIPEYPVKVLLSNSRRNKYFTPSDKLPKKYQTKQYGYHLGKLVNLETKRPVVRNAISAGKPRYIAISGNALYSGMHERVRMKIISELKDAIRPHLPTQPFNELIGTPIKITMKVYRTVGNADWDIDNFGIFWFKAFFDILRDKKLIPDDNIQYIVGLESKFIPIINDKKRRLEFVVTRSFRNEISDHLLYQPTPIDIVNGNDGWTILIDHSLETGKMLIDYDSKNYRINIGKRYIVWNALRKILTSIAVQSLILNEPINVSLAMMQVFGDVIRDVMFSHHIPVFVNNLQEDAKTKELFTKSIINGSTGNT